MQLAYKLKLHAMRHPKLLSRIFAAWRRWAALFGVKPVLSHDAALRAAFTRDDAFTNESHRAQLLAGEFLVGMPASPRHDRDRAAFEAMLPPLPSVRTACAQAAMELAGTYEARLDAGESFDLIEDYLMWVAMPAIELALGTYARAILGSHGSVSDADRMGFMIEARHVAAHLVLDTNTPARVFARGRAAAAALRQRVLEACASLPDDPRKDMIVRNLIGMCWVAHPVTVQAGALAMRELLGRPEWEALRQRVGHLGADGASPHEDEPLRTELRRHLLEATRHRPVFAAVPRYVPRDADVWVAPADPERGNGPRYRGVGAGKTLVLATQAALFDPQRGSGRDGKPVGESVHGFCPYLHPTDPAKANDDGWAMTFGAGLHECPGREVALEALVQAFIGLAGMPPLRFANWRWAAYDDGPMIKHARMVSA